VSKPGPFEGSSLECGAWGACGRSNTRGNLGKATLTWRVGCLCSIVHLLEQHTVDYLLEVGMGRRARSAHTPTSRLCRTWPPKQQPSRQRRCPAHRVVATAVYSKHGPRGGNAVQLLHGGVALLGHELNAVALALGPGALGQRGGVLFEHREELWDGLVGSGGASVRNTRTFLSANMGLGGICCSFQQCATRVENACGEVAWHLPCPPGFKMAAHLDVVYLGIQHVVGCRDQLQRED
jgi:hypothetical protein